jgi:drug/metabolite transporter (DMT)-like permease
MQGRTRRLALTEGVTAGVLFGTAAIFIRFLSGVDAVSIAFWRLVVGCLALVSLLIILRKPFHLGYVKSGLKDILILSLFLTLHFIFFISAVKDTTILNATILVNTTPLFSVFVSTFVFKLKPSRVAVLGLAISFVGVFTIAIAETSVASMTQPTGVLSSSLKGDVEAVLAALVESVYLNYGRRIRSEMSILSIMTPMYFFCALYVGVLSLPLTGGALALPTSLPSILSILGLGILPTAAAHTLYFSSLSNLKSFETATMALLEPIGATILGISLFQEIPAPLFIVGAAMILIGVFFVLKNKS